MTDATPKLHHFHGGIHLPGHKEMSTAVPVVRARLPRRLVIPLQQHIGAPTEAVVAVGELVLKGQLIGTQTGYVSAPVHASSSGTVVAIGEHAVPHPSGLSAPCVTIETDGQERWVERHPVADFRRLEPQALRQLVRDAGIVGMGGAGFPTAVKLGPSQPIQTLILNGAECEPYITCDDMLMRERAAEVIGGAEILQYILGAERCLVGVEDNKPQAYQALLAAALESELKVVKIPTIYPTGGEKQLIKVLTGKEVPSKGIPAQIGVVCHNVATAAAVYRAVRLGEPLISRVVTVTGSGVAHPCNLEVLVGTPVGELLEQCELREETGLRLLLGGPMMGFPLLDRSVTVNKASNCILAATAADVPPRAAPMPCIRCGECTRACPASLLPQQLYWHARAREFDKVQDYNLFDCIECGCCDYVCPSSIPLVQYYRFAKTEIWAQEREKKKADLARRRHEFRLARLEREKREKAERHQRAAAARAGTGTNADADAKKAAIQAALERAKAKRQAAAGSATPDAEGAASANETATSNTETTER